MSEEIKLPPKIAETICQMEEACYGEGIGPDTRELLEWIAEHYPHLVEDYSDIWWPK